MAIIFLLKTLLPIVLILLLIRWVIKKLRVIDESSTLSNNSINAYSSDESNTENKVEEVNRQEEYIEV